MIATFLLVSLTTPPDFVYLGDFTNPNPYVNGIRIYGSKGTSTPILQLKNQYMATISVSFDRRYLMTFSSPAAPPVQPSEGYTVTDARAATDSQVTRLYRWTNGQYHLIKDFGHLGYAREVAWNPESKGLAIQFVSGMMTMEPYGPYKLALIDAEHRSFKNLAQSDSYDGIYGHLCWTSDGRRLFGLTVQPEGLFAFDVASGRRQQLKVLKRPKLVWKPETKTFPVLSDAELSSNNAQMLPGGKMAVTLTGKDRVHTVVVQRRTGRMIWDGERKFGEYRWKVEQGNWIPLGWSSNEMTLQNWADGRVIVVSMQ